MIPLWKAESRWPIEWRCGELSIEVKYTKDKEYADGLDRETGTVLSCFAGTIFDKQKPAKAG